MSFLSCREAEPEGGSASPPCSPELKPEVQGEQEAFPKGKDAPASPTALGAHAHLEDLLVVLGGVEPSIPHDVLHQLLIVLCQKTQLGHELLLFPKPLVPILQSTPPNTQEVGTGGVIWVLNCGGEKDQHAGMASPHAPCSPS